MSPTPKPQHSPIPWKVGDIREIHRPMGEASRYEASVYCGPEYPRGIVARLDFGYGTKSDADNAALIVRAVNSHRALVEALKAAMAWLDKEAPLVPGQSYAEMVAQVRRALELAKESKP